MYSLKTTLFLSVKKDRIIKLVWYLDKQFQLQWQLLSWRTSPASLHVGPQIVLSSVCFGTFFKYTHTVYHHTNVIAEDQEADHTQLWPDNEGTPQLQGSLRYQWLWCQNEGGWQDLHHHREGDTFLNPRHRHHRHNRQKCEETNMFAIIFKERSIITFVVLLFCTSR